MTVGRVYSIFVVVLIGLVWPVYGQAEDDIWLNEVYTLHTGTALTAQVELVGRPKSTGADAPRQMTATLAFYASGSALIGTKTVTLTPGGATWNHNYWGVMPSASDLGDAFPSGTDIGGVVLSYGGEEKRVYCWGTTASTGSIAGDKNCAGIVSENSMNVATIAHARGAALYGAAGTNPGSKEGDYEWKDSEDEPDIDTHTLGALNTHATLTAQEIESWSFTDTSEVWLNEVDSTVPTVEIVGRPSSPPSNDEMVVTVQFYLDDDPKGDPAEVKLVSDDKFAGNYALSQAVADAGEAFPATASTIAGVVLTYGGVNVVYCWGDDADDGDAVIGEEIPCGRTVRTARPFTGEDKNSALYNSDDTGAEGEKESDFTWDISRDGTDGFSTLGDINACKAEAVGCVHNAQVLKPASDSPGEPGESPNNDMVWLNELYVVGDDVATDVVASLELVGRPVPSIRVDDYDIRDDTAAPECIKATVKFYDGSKEASIGDNDLEVEMKPQTTGGWNGNYVGYYEDSDKVYALAFLRNAEIGGISVAYGGQTRVYCWGPDAAVNEPVNGSTGSVKCETVVTTDHMQSDEGEVSVAMWNKASNGTPDGGGTKGDDFNWAKSIDSTSRVFETIGEENLCPSQTCSSDVIDQVLAPFTWGPDVNEDVVWLNEVNVVGAETSTDVVGSFEFVGRPTRVAGQDPPTSITATLTFYGGSGAIGTTHTVTLAPPSPAGDWNGNYAGTLVDNEGTYGEAFPRSDDTGGVKVEYEAESRVYCWGSDADEDVEVASGVVCQSPLFAVKMNAVNDESVNVAMYNQADGSPTGGGTKGGDFIWRLSEDTDNASFETIGSVNECQTSCGSTIVKQVLAKFDWERSTSTSTSTSTAASAAVAQRSVAAVGLAVGLVAGAM